MSDLATELQELCEAASFTMTDMATWIGFDKSAVREWIKFGVTPHPVKMKHIERRLVLLREVLKEGAGHLPVPTGIKQYDRVKYVEQVRDYALNKFSKSGIAG